MKDHVTPLQHGLIALDQLHANGDLTHEEYVAAVTALRPAIQRARLVDHLDSYVRAHNQATHRPVAARDYRDAILDALDISEVQQRDDIARLQLVTRRLEQLNGNSEEVLSGDSPSCAPPCAACGEPFTVEEWANREDAVHSDSDGEDIHARCCEACAEAAEDEVLAAAARSEEQEVSR